MGPDEGEDAPARFLRRWVGELTPDLDAAFATAGDVAAVHTATLVLDKSFGEAVDSPLCDEADCDEADRCGCCCFSKYCDIVCV
jgi:hypothetical protein